MALPFGNPHLTLSKDSIKWSDIILLYLPFLVPLPFLLFGLWKLRGYSWLAILIAIPAALFIGYIGSFTGMALGFILTRSKVVGIITGTILVVVLSCLANHFIKLKLSTPFPSLAFFSLIVASSVLPICAILTSSR